MPRPTRRRRQSGEDGGYGELIDDIDRLLARQPPAEKDHKIGRADFSVVFAPLFARPSANEGLKVDLRGRYSNPAELIAKLASFLNDAPPEGV